MTKAVRYDEFGGIEVLRIDEIDRPVPGDKQVLVRVKAAGINPGETAIRTGAMADIFPSTSPRSEPPRPSWSWSTSTTSHPNRAMSHGR